MTINSTDFARPLWVAATTALMIAPHAALGAGFQLAEQNASGLGSVFAGQAALAEDASAVYFNPAELTRLKAMRQLVGALHQVRPSSTFSDSGSCTPYLGAGAGTTGCPFGPNGNLGHAAGGDGGEVSDTGYVPNLYAAWALQPQRLWLGLGINAPFGLETNRDPAWVGRFQSIGSRTTAININPALAWKASDAVSLGFGLNIQRFTAELGNAVSYRAVALASGIPALVGAVPAGSEGAANIKGHDWGYGWNAGIGIQVNENLHLGASYRSPVRYKFRGDVRFDNRPAALGAVPQVADGAVEADIKLPDTLSLALSWQAVPGLTLLADWTRTGWDAIQDLVIVRADGPLAGQTLSSTAFRFKNSTRTGLGAHWKVNNAWVLRAGVASESSPVVDAWRTPRLADSPRTWYGIGAGFAPWPEVVVDFGLAWVRSKDGPSAVANQDTATSAPRGSLVGSYASHARIIGAQVSWSF